MLWLKLSSTESLRLGCRRLDMQTNTQSQGVVLTANLPVKLTVISDGSAVFCLPAQVIYPTVAAAAAVYRFWQTLTDT